MTTVLLFTTFANKIVVAMNNIEWIHPNTISGPAAEGDKYFKREYINDEFWEEIEKGVHILFTAPRRVGKTSIMKDIVKNSKAGYICRYENIESDKNQSQLFKRLFNMLLAELKTHKKYKKQIQTWFKGRGIGEMSVDGAVKFTSKTIDYKSELLELLAELNTIETKIILFLDEFPEVIASIKRSEGAEKTIETLHTLRAIRQNENFKNFVLVFAGSIGLEQVVEDLDRPKLVNDLHRIRIPVLLEEEGKNFIQFITKSSSITISDETSELLLNRIGYLIPYFIQKMVEECNKILHRKTQPKLTQEEIEQAFNNLLKYDENLKDWESRLKEPYLAKKASTFCKEILTTVSHNEQISIQEIYNISQKHQQNEEYMNRINMLERDGYIVEEDGSYKFLSPVLKMWWQRQHPKFEIEN